MTWWRLDVAQVEVADRHGQTPLFFAPGRPRWCGVELRARSPWVKPC